MTKHSKYEYSKHKCIALKSRGDGAQDSMEEVTSSKHFGEEALKKETILFSRRISRAAGVGGRLPADAVGDDPPGGRQPPPLRQHLHIPPLPTALLQQGHPQVSADLLIILPSFINNKTLYLQEQASHGHQDEELWVRLIANSDRIEDRQKFQSKKKRRNCENQNG